MIGACGDLDLLTVMLQTLHSALIVFKPDIRYGDGSPGGIRLAAGEHGGDADCDRDRGCCS